MMDAVTAGAGSGTATAAVISPAVPAAPSPRPDGGGHFANVYTAPAVRMAITPTKAALRYLDLEWVARSGHIRKWPLDAASLVSSIRCSPVFMVTSSR